MSGGEDRELAIWDLRTNILNHKVTDIHKNDINTVAVQEQYIITGGQEGRVNIVDDRVYKVVEQFDDPHSPIFAIKVSPLGDELAVGKNKLGLYSLGHILETHTLSPKCVDHGLKDICRLMRGQHQRVRLEY